MLENMAKSNKEKVDDVEVKEPKEDKTEFSLIKNVGSKKDGSAKKVAGSKVSLTKDEAAIYKLNKLI